ncbi:PAS domain S-box protein [Haloparvum sedimenti]|uniref:PAS domain S-box protein n=1 Tax=Haloparvum sedimenti TaxID=1678448 RepID=UPI00071E7A87|nr:PAS domain S-box protein [Haloparvum sedimenti]
MSDQDASIRVLHVEDDPEFAEMAGAFLEREDDRIRVRSAADAEEALELLSASAFDCVVSDYEMPGLNGIELLRAVREDHPDLPFILFTGKGSEEVAGEAISAGVTDYLQKGTATEQYELLANRIDNAVDATQARRKLSERTRRLETLISNLPGMIYRCRNEPDWPMMTVGGEVEALTGYSAATLERNEVKWGTDVLHPDDREEMWAAVQDALDTDGSFEVTYRIVTADGATRWAWERGRGVYDDGELVALEGFITDITDRKRREERLQRTTARLEALFEDSPDMIDVHDVEGNILDANPRLCRETGYDEAELTDMTVADLDRRIDPEDTDEIWRDIPVGDRLELETVYERRDGSTFPVEVHVRRLDLDGEERFIVNSRNIADRKRRERKLEQLREWTRELNHTQSTAETARLANEAADELIGATLSGVHLLNEAGTVLEPVALGDSVPDMFEDPPSYDRGSPGGSRAALAWEAFEGEESIYLPEASASPRLDEETPAESVLLHPIGDRGLFIISSPEAYAFTETDRFLVEILANHLETALERVTREETLRTREDRLGQLHDATRDLIRAESRDAIADCAVAAAEEILGFSATVVRLYDPEANGLVPIAESDSVSDTLPEREVFTPESGSLNWKCYEAGTVGVYDDIEDGVGAVDRGTGLRSLMVLPIGDHGTISVGETEPNAFDATDEFLARILATATETAFDELEREHELRQRRDELKRQNERLEEFAHVVSHDLRNPLTVAQGRLDLALEETDNEHLPPVSRALDRMGELIDDLLTLARNGEAVGDPESVDLAALAAGCWENVGETNAAACVVETDRTVRADRSRLQQLLENLMANAVEHGGPHVTVTVGDLPDGFYVEDDGVGVPETDRGTVFEAGHSTSSDGTGFGLSIVQGIAEAHDWGVRLVEGESGGARVEVTGVDTAGDA